MGSCSFELRLANSCSKLREGDSCFFFAEERTMIGLCFEPVLEVIYLTS